MFCIVELHGKGVLSNDNLIKNLSVVMHHLSLTTRTGCKYLE